MESKNNFIQIPENDNKYSAIIRNKVCIPTEYGDCCFCSFNNLSDNKEHFALVFGEIMPKSIPLVRIHSECITGDLFQSRRCDCGNQLTESIKRLQKEGGILLYLRQEGRGIGLYNKLEAYELQLKGFDTYEANQKLHFEDDLRSYVDAAQMLHALNVKKIRLITNNPEKVKQIAQNQISVVERVGTESYLKPENYKYLEAKVKKTGHFLNNFIEARS